MKKFASHLVPVILAVVALAPLAIAINREVNDVNYYRLGATSNHSVTASDDYD